MSSDSSSSEAEANPANERLVLFILAAVQFITIVDFMIVMPLGPQLMRSLDIGPAAFGLIVSSYTFAAGAAGLVASVMIDRFSRRAAFMILYVGFLVGTLLCGLALNYQTLVIARFATGAFGGILGGISLAIIGDVFPEQRRGRATGSLMTGFAIASVAGVPLGLVIGTNFGWQMAFIALAIAGAPILALAMYSLPMLDSHLSKTPENAFRSLITTFSHINHLNAFALAIALTFSGFLIFPYMSAFFVGNIGMTEHQLPLVYIAGGSLTLFASPMIGRMADKYGKLLVFRVIAPVSAILIVSIPQLPFGSIGLSVVCFGVLMVCNAGRMIPAMAMITSSVRPQNRGAFLSANSSLQHIAGGFASYLGGLIVIQAEDESLQNFATVAWISAGCAVSSLWLAGRLRVAGASIVSAEAISLPAAAEAAVDANEPMVTCVKANGTAPEPAVVGSKA